MIFVTVGSQMFQFNRLLKEIDDLIEKGVITDTVFAQTGSSTYVPRNYRFKDFLNQDEFNDTINQSEFIMTHGGTGAIVKALKSRKKVIAVARLEKYHEVVDDHQLELIQKFTDMGLMMGVEEVSQLENTLLTMNSFKFKSFVSNTAQMVNIIDDFIMMI